MNLSSIPESAKDFCATLHELAIRMLDEGMNP